MKAADPVIIPMRRLKKDWHVCIFLSNSVVLNFIVEAVTGREAMAETEAVKHLLAVPDHTNLDKVVRIKAERFFRRTNVNVDSKPVSTQ